MILFTMPMSKGEGSLSYPTSFSESTRDHLNGSLSRARSSLESRDYRQIKEELETSVDPRIKMQLYKARGLFRTELKKIQQTESSTLEVSGKDLEAVAESYIKQNKLRIAKEIAILANCDLRHGSILNKVAKAYLAKGELKEARKIGLQAICEVFEGKILKKVAKAHLAKGQLEEAKEIGQLARMNLYHDGIMKKVANAHLKRGELEQAQKIAVSVGFLLDQDSLLEDIALAYRQQNDLKQSEELASLTHFVVPHDRILERTAICCLRLDKPEEARRIGLLVKSPKVQASILKKIDEKEWQDRMRPQAISESYVDGLFVSGLLLN